MSLKFLNDIYMYIKSRLFPYRGIKETSTFHQSLGRKDIQLCDEQDFLS